LRGNAHDKSGAIVLRQKWSRGQVESRLANMPPCLVGMEACVGAHHLARRLISLGHNARLMPAKYVRPYAKGQKNDFNDAEAITEAVQRPTMKFVAVKTGDQLDLQALHRVRERLVSQRTAIINQIRAFLLERGVAVRQGLRILRAELPMILGTRTDALSPRILRLIEDLAGDWRRLDARIEQLSAEIVAIAKELGRSCQGPRLRSDEDDRCSVLTCLSLASCSASSRRGLQAEHIVATSERRPASTSPARDAVKSLQVGTGESRDRTREIG